MANKKKAIRQRQSFTQNARFSANQNNDDQARLADITQKVDKKSSQIDANVTISQLSNIGSPLGRFVSKYSENIGGVVSMAGSSLFTLGGDLTGITVTASFLVAEAILTRWGHTRAGYSAGAALFAIGDGLATLSNVADGNHAFQIALTGMAVTWGLGALRAPLAAIGQKLNKPNLVRIADGIQPVVGTLALIQRLPGIAAAFVGAKYIGAAAVTCWAISDVLVGRLQNTWKATIGSLGKRKQAPQEADRPARNANYPAPSATAG